MTTTKQTPSKTDSAPTVCVEYDYGTKGERRIKDFTDASKVQKFIKSKENAGKNPKELMSSCKAVEAVQAPSVPGVRPTRTRPYLAGKIIAKYGFTAGVTEGMVAELDAAYGKPNPTESQFCLKNAFHAARGFLGIAENAIE